MYGACVAGAVTLGHSCKSRNIANASLIVAAGWVCSVQFWLLLDGDALTLAYLLLDIGLAAVFFQMARRRLFPVPLCLLQAVVIVFHFYILSSAHSQVWMLAVLNRSLDLALVYIAVCSTYRLRKIGASRHSRPD